MNSRDIWRSVVDRAITDGNVGRDKRNRMYVAWGRPPSDPPATKRLLRGLLSYRDNDFELFGMRNTCPGLSNALLIELSFPKLLRLPSAPPELFGALEILQQTVSYTMWPYDVRQGLAVSGVDTWLDLDTLTGRRLRDALRRLLLSSSDAICVLDESSYSDEPSWH